MSTIQLCGATLQTYYLMKPNLYMFVSGLNHAPFDLDTTIYTVNENPIKQLLQHKDLGIIFSYNIKWTDHYKTITTKAYQILGLIRRTFRVTCIEAE